MIPLNKRRDRLLEVELFWVRATTIPRRLLLQSWLPASDKKKPGLRGSGPGFYFLLSLPGMKRVAHDCEPRAQCQNT